jgi:hypothetical protein
MKTNIDLPTNKLLNDALYQLIDREHKRHGSEAGPCPCPTCWGIQLAMERIDELTHLDPSDLGDAGAEALCRRIERRRTAGYY